MALYTYSSIYLIPWWSGVERMVNVVGYVGSKPPVVTTKQLFIPFLARDIFILPIPIMQHFDEQPFLNPNSIQTKENHTKHQTIIKSKKPFKPNFGIQNQLNRWQLVPAVFEEIGNWHGRIGEPVDEYCLHQSLSIMKHPEITTNIHIRCNFL